MELPPSVQSERIEIPLCWAHSTHVPPFSIHRPGGNGVYIFLHFQEPITIHDVTGDIFFPRYGAILYAPGFTQFYHASDNHMLHSWFHCTGPGADLCVAKYNLPVNKALYLGEFGHLVPFIQAVQREKLRRDPYWEDAISFRAANFFLELSRAIQRQQNTQLTAAQRDMLERLNQARATVHSDLQRQWTVEEMAEIVHLSTSRLTSLYALFFGVSPLDDLIASRIQHACNLLEMTTLPVDQIAHLCGFRSPAHFSRLFRQRIGCPPSRYRIAAAPSLNATA